MREVVVWIVDGAYVRKNLDEEFSNFGHHFSFKCIPKDEIWLDQETDPDEQAFYVRHATTERRLRASGADAETAREAANKAEQRLRARSRDLQTVAPARSLPKPERVHVALWKSLGNGVKVWLVKGRLVRSVFDIEFTEGGHEHVYEYVPRGEVWIDDDVHEEEKGYVLFHELFERNLMARGMEYDRAHAEASKRERYLRKHPTELHQALSAEGWE